VLKIPEKILIHTVPNISSGKVKPFIEIVRGCDFQIVSLVNSNSLTDVDQQGESALKDLQGDPVKGRNPLRHVCIRYNYY